MTAAPAATVEAAPATLDLDNPKSAADRSSVRANSQYASRIVVSGAPPPTSKVSGHERTAILAKLLNERQEALLVERSDPGALDHPIR